MAIQANKPNSRIFLLLGVVLAAAAAISVLLLLRSNTGGNQVSVVVTTSQVPAGTALTAQMVTVTQVPSAVKPLDAYTDPAAVVGKTPSVTLQPNTPVVPAFFASASLAVTSAAGTGGAQVDVETQILKGFVAVAIPTSAVVPTAVVMSAGSAPLSSELVSAGFYIQPGDHIDILVETGAGAGGIRFAFQDVLVMRVGAAGSAAAAGGTVLLVEVKRSQVELLTALVVAPDHAFAVKYVLRPQSEWGKQLPDGAYTPNYVASAGAALPVPADTAVTPSQLDALFGR